MNEIELKMMQGMVDILNEAKSSYLKGCPIMNKEQYDSRIKDLIQFEQETGFVLLNSPTQDIELKHIVEEGEIFNHRFKEMSDVKSIIKEKSFGLKNVVAYANLDGVDTSITYKDGVVIRIEVCDIEYLKHVNNIPYKINRDGLYCVRGKVTLVDDKPKFFVDEIINDIDDSINKSFERAKVLGFDIVPNWFAYNLNSKTLQETVDYMFDYIKEEGMDCNGITFRSDDIKCTEIIELESEGDN